MGVGRLQLVGFCGTLEGGLSERGTYRCNPSVDGVAPSARGLGVAGGTCVCGPLLGAVLLCPLHLPSVSPGCSCAKRMRNLLSAQIVPDTSLHGDEYMFSKCESSRTDNFSVLGVCDPCQEGHCHCSLGAHPAYPAM